MDADAAQQHSQAQLRYRKLVDTLPGCVVFVLDQNLRVTFAGGGLVANTAFHPATYFGRPVAEFAAPSVYALAEPYLLATLAGEETSFEFDYPAGPSFEVRTTPLQEDSRSVTEILVIALDTTVRKRAEAAERNAQRALHQAVEAANIGLWNVDLRTSRVHYSLEWKQQLGYEDGEIGDTLDEWACRLHPDDREKARDLALAFMAAPWPSYAQEFRLQHKDGSYRWILARGTVDYDADGKPAHALGVHIDITEKKLAAETMAETMAATLAAERDRLATVLDSLPVGVWIAAMDGQLIAKNRQTDLIWHGDAPLGAGIDVYTEYPAWDAQTGKLLLPEEYPMAQALRSGESIAPYELRIRRLDGSKGRVLASAVPLRDPQGNPAGVVGINVDISEREQLREQLQRQEQLAAVGQLAAGIAHDFNNIMSVISVYAEMTSEAPGLTDKERARTLTIMEQTQRAARMIRQILDFSRQAVYERQALDLLPLFKEEAKLLRQTLPENVEIRLDYVPGEYIVRADPTRMQQLLVNLALNACDAMPEGGALHVGVDHFTAEEQTLVPGLGAGKWVRLIVSDTGAGIRPEHLEHIFEPFFTTKEPGRGTGLGLAQVQGIVAQHEGHIAVASELGAGTIFTIYLPAVVTQAPAATALEEAPSAEVLPQGHGECVLLVEDDGEVRSSLAALLEGWNYRVVQAGNGQEALVCLARPWQQVDVILSDVIMPRLGGIGLVKALRKDGVTTPVILMSGYAAGEAPAGLKGAGVAAWLDKPPSSAALAGALASALVRG
ncbi:MAG: PAS domain-containing protein [Caldilineaceae bacterium]